MGRHDGFTFKIIFILFESSKGWVGPCSAGGATEDPRPNFFPGLNQISFSEEQWNLQKKTRQQQIHLYIITALFGCSFFILYL